MIKHKKILIIISLILLFSAASWGEVIQNGDLWKATCSCPCKEGEIGSSAVYKTNMLAGPTDESLVRFTVNQLCQDQCARNCGGLTACSSNDNSVCTTCCNSYCSTDYRGSMRENCSESCSSACAYTGVVNNIVEIIYLAAGVIAALMIVICGIRILTAQDPNDRNAAKRTIMYVIFALVVIIFAVTIAQVFFKPVTTIQSAATGPPATITQPINCANCGGASPCTDAGCHGVGRCWFEGVSRTCNACQGSISVCADYIAIDECNANPCQLSTGCHENPYLDLECKPNT